MQDFTIGGFSFPAGWHNQDDGSGAVIKDFADTANDWFDVGDDRYAPDWLSSLWFDVQFLGLSPPHWYTLPSAADLAPASYALFSVQILGSESSLTPIYLMSGSITSVTTTSVSEPPSALPLAHKAGGDVEIAGEHCLTSRTGTNRILRPMPGQVLSVRRERPYSVRPAPSAD